MCFAAVFIAGCHRYLDPASALAVANPAVSKQLLFGFYPPEPKFRWVKRQFGVALKPPDHIAVKGAHVMLRLFIPDNEIRMLHSLTLTASAEGQTLGEQTYSKSGSYRFEQPIAPALLDTNILPISFCFDKAMPPTEVDGRELAAVVTDIAIVAGSGK